MRQPKVSIIVPVYNSEDYLDNCIRSLLGQTLSDIEIIFVDDGSTDSSPSLLQKYQNGNSQIVVIRQENSGAGAARNRGVNEAMGEYIGFVDSDDCIDPNMFLTLYNRAKADDSDLVMCGVRYSNGGIHYFTDAATMYLMGRKPFSVCDYPSILQSCFLWNRLYRRKFYIENKVSIPVGRKYAEDVLPCMTTIVCANKISFISQPFYTYVTHNGSLTDKLFNGKDEKKDFILAFEETKNFFKRKEIYSIVQNAFLLFMMNLSFAILDNLKGTRSYRSFLNGLCKTLDKNDIIVIKDLGFAGSYPYYFHQISQRVDAK